MKLHTSTAIIAVAYANTAQSITAAQAAVIRDSRAAAQSISNVNDEMLRRSPASAAMLKYWDKTDAIVDGEEAVNNMNATFLPRFKNEKSDDYDTRSSMTKFTNIYRDIVENLSTKPFEEEISLVKSEADTAPPEKIIDFAEDVDGAGNSLTVFAATTFFNGINSAIDWIFVDYPSASETSNIRTIADEKASGVRPFWSHVLGRNVLDARTNVINGKETLIYIRIFEPGAPDHVRVFERGADGIVTWALYVKTDAWSSDNKTQFILKDSGIITIGVIPLVPFITGRRDGRTFRVFPAMQDAADLQIQLYQQESALKFLKTISAYPMLAANGIKPRMKADGKTPEDLAIGPMKVLYGSPNSNGDVGSWEFIQPDAAILKFLADDVKATVDQLRELGRQPLTAQSSNLTVITTAVAATKSKSAVGAWALILKNTLENAFVISAMWMNIAYEPQVNVYNEFDDFTDGGADLAALQGARTARDISQETFWSELKRRKTLAPEFNAELERERLLAEVPDDPNLDPDNPDDPGNPEPKPKVKS